MHIPIEHHRRVVGILLAVILGLLILPAVLVWQFGFFHQPLSYLQGQEVVIIGPAGGSQKPTILPVQKVLFEYVEIINSCGPHFDGVCVNVRSGPGADFPAIMKLRNGIVLKVGGEVDRDGHAWYKIVFDEPIRYPERITTDWYVSGDFTNVLMDEGTLASQDPNSLLDGKRIVISRSQQMLYAYEDGKLFMQAPISTGVELNPTPRGIFTIFKKTPSRYMQGPIPGITDQYYDLPGVPWDLYFTYQGAAIHGTYWHENFGKPASHGCVNLPPDQAHKLYSWAEVGTQVIVQD